MAEWIDTLAASLDDRAARSTRVAQPPGEEAAQAHPTEEYFLAREVVLAARVRQEIEQFFIAATVLEGKEPRILGWDDADAALELMRSSAT